MTSHSSARTTSAVAQSASALISRRAARRAWEEDHPLGAGRDLVEAAHELRLAAPGLARDGHSGPHALVELVTKRVDQHLLVARDLRVALGDQLLPMTRPHAQELHRTRDYATPAAPPRRSNGHSGVSLAATGTARSESP